MKKKIIGSMCMLLVVATVFSVAGTMNINTGYSPVSNEDEWTMFLHDSGRVGYSKSLAPNTATVRWEFEPPGSCVKGVDSSPAVVDGKVYFSTWDEYFFCLDADTGQSLWSYYDDSFSSCSPAVYDGKVYVSSASYFYCFNADTGDVIWEFNIGFRGSHPAPVVVNDKVYFAHSRSTTGSGDAGLYCFDAGTGDMLWNYNFGYLSVSSPAVAYGRVYIGIGEKDEKIYCFNANSGDIFWTFDLIGKYGGSTPTVNNGKVYFGDEYALYCLDAYSGNQQWSYDVYQMGSSPAIAYGNIYISDFNGVYCINIENRTEIWSYEVNGGYGNSPVVADDKVYVGMCFTGDFLCLNASTGRKLWSYMMSPYGFTCSAGIAYGRVYIGSGDANKIYCFEDKILPSPSVKGETGGVVNRSYSFDIVTREPDGNDVRYFVDWSDGTNSGWTEYYDSGKSITVSHTWSSPDIYIMKVRAESRVGIKSNATIYNMTIIDGAILEIQLIKGGLFSVQTVVINSGTKDAIDIDWSIILDGGSVLFGKETVGTGNIPVDDEVAIKSKFIFGFGNTAVRVNAIASVGFSDMREQQAFVFLCFINVKPSG